MLSGWLVAVSIAVSPGQCTTCGPGGGMAMGGGMQFSPGMMGGSYAAGMGGFGNPYDSVSAGGGGGGDQLYPFDSPEPWLHGYFQEIPAYGGYASFRPHNYKHVLAQMDVAGRWGISPTMAYSHQWYHRYRQRAGMHPNFGTPYAASQTPSYGNIAAAEPASPPPSREYFQADDDNKSLIQAAAMDRGYSGTPIPGISVPNYQFSEVPRGRQAPGDEYLAQLDRMQNVIDQQTYQMQVLQQQLHNSAAAPPAFNQAAVGQTGSPQVYNAQVLAPQSGYQELPPPAAYQQAPIQSIPQALPQQSFVPQTLNQPSGLPIRAPAAASQYGGLSSPAYPAQQTPSIPSYTTPQYGQPTVGQPVYGQPALGQPAPQTVLPAQPTPSTQGIPGPILQVPAGQAYFSGQPTNANQAGFVVPNQTVIPGQQAMWQQPTPQQTLVPMNQSSAPAPQAFSYGYGTAQPAPQPGYYQQQGHPANGMAAPAASASQALNGQYGGATAFQR